MWTICSIRDDLTALGLTTGDTVLVHSSLRKIGNVISGAEAVVRALLDVVGPTGTIVVPTHSGDNSDPANWTSPPVADCFWDLIRQNTLPYDPHTTKTRGMGAVADMLRRLPGAVRSMHPQTSMAAVGRNAGFITEVHELDCALGETSPLARLEQLDAKILLLGVGYDCCTMMHLAEGRLARPKMAPNSFAATVDGQRQWMTVTDVLPESDDFEKIGADFEAEHSVTMGKVGHAECRVVRSKEVVAFAQEWMTQHRSHT